MTTRAGGHQLQQLGQLTSPSATRHTHLLSPLRHKLVGHTGIAIIETLLGVALISAVGVLIPGHWGLLDIHPHPLWILVVAIALRYGVGPGYMAGTLSALSYTLFLCFQPRQGVHIPSTNDLIQPFFLFVGSILVSELTKAHHQQLTTLQEQIDSSQSALLGVLSERQTLTQVDTELKGQVEGQSAPLHVFYELTKKAGTLCTREIYRAILEVVGEALEAEACAIYLLRDGQLHLCVGAPEVYPERPPTLSPQAGLVGRALHDGRTVSIRDHLFAGGPDAVTDGRVMLAGLLRDREGHATGVVTVERLPFLKLNVARIRLFDAVLEWSSVAIANARDYEALSEHARGLGPDSNEGNAPSNALPVAQTIARLQEDFARAVREQLPLSLLVMQMARGTNETTHLVPAFLHMLSVAVQRCMRRVDTFGALDQSDTFVLLLPGMPVDGAKILTQCMLTDLYAMTRRADCSLTVRVGIASRADHASAEELLAEALPARRPKQSGPIRTRGRSLA